MDTPRTIPSPIILPHGIIRPIHLCLLWKSECISPFINLLKKRVRKHCKLEKLSWKPYKLFLKKYDHIPPREKSMDLLLAEERFLKIKQAFEEEQNQPEIIQELLIQLIHDLQRLEKSIAELLAEEQADTINSLYQNPDLLQSFIYQDDDNDDDDYDKESILSINTDMFETPSPDAITTSSLIEEPKDSLIMEDEDINTIPEKESRRK
ncbi:hypothetical protein Tco_0676999 [Tanacetum coccineum]